MEKHEDITIIPVGDDKKILKVGDRYLVEVDGEQIELPIVESEGSIVDFKCGDLDSMSSISETTEGEPDPWDIVPGLDEGPRWNELTVVQKIKRVSWISVRLLGVICLLYFFICSLGVLQDAFQLLGGRVAGSIFTNNVLISNPLSGLMIGVLVTVLVQSSSTSTSIVVSMVGSGLLQVRPAIPIIMGANIGTTVTNTLVALTQSMDRTMFRRAFAGATVHDAFNWLTVLILLPLEVATGYLYYMTSALVKGLQSNSDSEEPQFLKVITDPLTTQIVQIDKKVITAIAQETDRQKFPLAKYYCKEISNKYSVNMTGENYTLIDEVNSRTFTYNVRLDNDTSSGSSFLNWTEVLESNSTKCTHLFVGTGVPGNLSEAAAGAILLLASLLVLILCLLLMVKILNSLLRGTMATLVRKSINADLPGKAAFLTGYLAILIGAAVTVLVQSSSVFTSTLTPLVGIGVVTIERVYPLTLGSNIGTTITSILAALTADADMIQYTMQIALCHLFFNISGILLFYPIPPLRRVPIRIAKCLGSITAKYRWFAIVYLISMFLVLPFAIFGLSLAGRWVLVGVGVPIALLLIAVAIINVLQSKRQQWLPNVLRDWEFLPKPLHSLSPYDRVITSCCACCHDDEEEGKESGSCGTCCKKTKVNSSSSSTILNLSRASSCNVHYNDGISCVKVTPIDACGDERTNRSHITNHDHI
jgi:sodium-dependent phosphate cotransporter